MVPCLLQRIEGAAVAPSVHVSVEIGDTTLSFPLRI